MIYCEFFVPGKPQGKGRPRFGIGSGCGKRHAYTPHKTALYEAQIRRAATEAWQCLVLDDESRNKLRDAPCRVRIVALHPLSKSWPLRQKQLALQGRLCPYKPDVDNLCKAVLDALNGVLWRDDVQVQSVAVSKHHAMHAGVAVMVQWAESDDELLPVPQWTEDVLSCRVSS